MLNINEISRQGSLHTSNKLDGISPPPDATNCSGDDELSSILFRKYKLGRILGRGAFAKVYHAHNVHTGQDVAIKSVSKQRILKDNLSSHIKREISIMSRIRHHGIVRLHEVLATKTKIYFIMEFVKGGELFHRVNKGRRFTEDLSRRYFHQLISAVEYCHSHGIYHRDLKLENLLLDENWELKVTDFGLSAVTEQTQPDGMLHTACGTPAYVAPEILRRKGYDGSKIDVWSCGVILYVLSAGYLPFNNSNLMAMYKKIYRGDFRCPRWFSPDLKRFLSRILDPNPKTRITVQEMKNDPWFTNGYEDTRIIPYTRELEFFKESGNEARFLNAFDIISFSNGADLTGLFCDSGNNSIGSEIFVSNEIPGRIIERIEELAKEEQVTVARKGVVGVRLEGQKGDFIVMVELNRLTEELVLVNVKRSGSGRDFWNERFKTGLEDLVYRQTATGSRLLVG